MATYRKKPVVIEAKRFWDVHNAAQPPGVCIKQRLGRSYEFGLAHVHTLEGVMSVDRGDYIIRGVQGEYYPCKPEIFEATYELVDDRIWAGCSSDCGCGCPGEACTCPASDNLPERCGCLGWVREPE